MQPNEMAVYLRRGLGRVVLFLREQTGGAAHFRDVISHAVLHDVRFGSLDDERAFYLYKIVQATGEPDWYAARLCDAMKQAAEENDERQRCELAARFAEAGNEDARRALYQAFERSVRTGEPVGTEAVIALDGTAGFQTAATLFVRFPTSDDDFRKWSFVDLLVEKLGGRETARQAVEYIAVTVSEIAPYLHLCWEDWEHIIGNGREERLAKERQTVREAIPQTYEAFQSALDENDRAKGVKPSPFRFWGWGRTASDETMERLAHDLVHAIETGITSQERLRCLLYLFKARAFPLTPAPLLPLTVHPKLRISSPAVQALSLITHPDIRAQGLRLIAEEHAANGIKLLVKNPDASDAVLFADLLHQTRDEEDLHYIGISLRRYLEANPLPNKNSLLLHLYENGPCSMCRVSVVKMLLDAKALPENLRAECQYDADEGTREMVAPSKT